MAAGSRAGSDRASIEGRENQSYAIVGYHPVASTVGTTRWATGQRLATRDQSTMANKTDHLEWADAHERLAEEWYLSNDPTTRRWAVIAVYYSLLHIVHAIAAERWNLHPEAHKEVFEIPERIDPSRPALGKSLRIARERRP